jgi:nitrile hydratase accessory protein
LPSESLFSQLSLGDEQPFKEPWQAHAFAMAVKLHEQGLFTWTEWAETIGGFIKNAGPDDSPDNYYHHWMSALETIVDAKSAASTSELEACRGQWDRAAKATPHGTPILLEADPLA